MMLIQEEVSVPGQQMDWWELNGDPSAIAEKKSGKKKGSSNKHKAKSQAHHDFLPGVKPLF